MEETAENKELMKGQEDDKQTSLEDKMNPLEIPVVVQIIGSYINKVEDLKSVRTLRTCWRDETLKKWRNSAVLLINNETLPLLLQVYSEQNWEDLSKEEKDRIDPFQLREVPFKGYRFSKEQSWAYPLKDNELDKKLIWEKVIKPNATYLDVGESAMKWYGRRDEKYRNYSYGVYWIVTYSENVRELAMAPIKSDQGLGEEPEGNELINYAPASRNFNWLSETKAVQLETLTISEPEIVENENQDCFLFDDEDHRVDFLARNLFCRTPNLKNFQLKLTDIHQTSDVMEGLRISIYKNHQIQLFSLEALGMESDLWRSNIAEIDQERNTLKELKISFSFSDSAGTDIASALDYAKEKLTRLELDIDCEKKFNKKPPIQTDLQLFMVDFPNLVRLNVNLDYKTFPGRLLKFNINDLKGMPTLEEFHFGTKGNLVYKAWITRKLDFDENATYPERRGFVKLTCLKSFHLHGNFTKEALQKLGRMMENLKTLEVVLDKENFSAVKEVWSGLRNLKLLPCSDVAEEDVKALEDSNPSWNVINDSANYSCALNKT